jgi:hypothetical protein
MLNLIPKMYRNILQMNKNHNIKRLLSSMLVGRNGMQDCVLMLKKTLLLIMGMM